MVKRQDASTGEMVEDGKPAEQPAADAGGKPIMHVKIYSPYKVYFDGDATVLSGENGTGPFDILPNHRNFISLLNPCELVLNSVSDGENRIKVTGGILHVKKNVVSVFLQV